MKRFTAAGALACAAALSAACGAEPGAQEPSAQDATRSTDAAPARQIAPAPLPSGPAAAVDAPDFAVLYPGSELDAPAVTASGPAGPGGMVTYTVQADPDSIIAFYRRHAEAAGLASVMAMNQGEARAYGAAKPDEGANLQVVASPTEGGQTSVQLSWTAGG